MITLSYKMDCVEIVFSIYSIDFICKTNNSHGFVYFTAATNGVVLATEKKQKSVLYDEHSIHKIEMITKNIGMVYSGMGPDYRYVTKCTNHFWER